MRKSAWGIVAGIVAEALLGQACAWRPDAGAAEHLRRGDHYAATQRDAEALIEYRTALQRAPGSAEAHLKLAEVYGRLRDPRRSADEYVFAADLQPARADLAVRAGQALLTVRRFAEAGRRAAAALRIAPGNVDAQLLSGYALAGMQDVENAAATLTAALKDSPLRADAYVNVGILDAARGRTDEAEAAFHVAWRRNPSSARTALALATLYASSSRPDAADTWFARALALAPADPIANIAAATFALAQGRAADAGGYLETAARSGAPGAQFLLADYDLAMGRRDEGIALLEKLAATPATFVAATTRLALGERTAGQTTRAYQLLEGALARHPNDPIALNLRVEWLIADARFGEAIDSLTAATAARARVWQPQQRLGEAFAGAGRTRSAIAALSEAVRENPELADARLALGRLLLVERAPDKAIHEADQVLERDPERFDAAALRISALIARREYTTAQRDIGTWLQRRPDAPALYIDRGEIAARQGDEAAAIQAFTHARTLAPDSIEALAGLVASQVRSHQLSPARRAVDTQLASQPGNARLLLLAAKVAAAAADPIQTEQLLQRSIAADPDGAEAYDVLSRFYIARHRWADAERQLEVLGRRRPESVYVQTLLASVLQVQGKAAAASERYAAAIALDPEAAVAMNNLAWLAAESGDLETARPMAEMAQQQLPDRPEVTDTVGWVYYRQQWADEALPLFQQSVRRAPAQPLYRYHLGLAHAALGHTAEARAALTSALTLSTRFTGATDAANLLARLDTGRDAAGR